MTDHPQRSERSTDLAQDAWQAGDAAGNGLMDGDPLHQQIPSCSLADLSVCPCTDSTWLGLIVNLIELGLATSLSLPMTYVERSIDFGITKVVDFCSIVGKKPGGRI